MPAQVILVHDDETFRLAVATALEAEGYTGACYPDALAAAKVLPKVDLARLLITQVNFRPGRSNGASLAMMLKNRKMTLRVIFAALPDTQEHVAGMGTFLPMPVAIPDLVQAVRREIGRPPVGGGSIQCHCGA